MISKISFVAINILSSCLLFARSVLFLKYLPDNELGMIMLFQAVVAMLGLSQIGLYNGGLRIFSIDREIEHHQVANNTNVTYTILITLSFVLVSLVAHFIFNFNVIIFVFAALAGGFGMMKNWFSNLLVARKKLKNINLLNFISAVVSSGLSFTIFFWDLYGALLSISSGYIVFVLIFMFTAKEHRPSGFYINFISFKMMLAFGFIPFLSGIASIINSQIDRFFIAEAISLEALGQFYLAGTFITIFNLLPANLNSLFAPVAINSYAEKQLSKTLKTTTRFFLILLVYSFFTWLLLVFFGEQVVNLVFPERIGQLKYLFIMLPGIMALTMSKPFSFLLYVALNLKAILWSNIFSLSSYLIILISLLQLSLFTIENVALSKSIQGCLVLVFLVLATVFSFKHIKVYRYTENKQRK